MRFSVRVKPVNWLAVLCSVTRSIFVCVSERPHSLVFFAPLYEFPVWVMPTLRSAARQSCRDRYCCVLYYRYIVFINVQSTANYGILLCRFFFFKKPLLNLYSYDIKNCHDTVKDETGFSSWIIFLGFFDLRIVLQNL